MHRSTSAERVPKLNSDGTFQESTDHIMGRKYRLFWRKGGYPLGVAEGWEAGDYITMTAKHKHMKKDYEGRTYDKGR